jgi:hypothetical protein
MVTKQKTVTKSRSRKIPKSPQKPVANDSASVRVLTVGFALLSLVFAAIAFANYS